MKLLLNGSFSDAVLLQRGSDGSFKATFMDDDGGAIDQTGETWSLEIYDTADRRNAVKLSLSFTAGVATGGIGTIAWTDTNADTLTAGANLFAYAKRVDGSATSFSKNYIPVKVS